MNSIFQLKHQNRMTRTAGWIAIFALAFWVPGCNKTDNTPVEPPKVVAVEGAPIDAPLQEPTAEIKQPVAEMIASTTPEAVVSSTAEALVAESTGVYTPYGSLVANPEATAPPLSATDEIAASTHDLENQGPDDFYPTSFQALSEFDYEVPNPMESDGLTDKDVAEMNKQIPDTIKRLNQKQVAVKGFMVPVDFAEGKITSFILTNNMMMCCFGIIPWYNEWVFVEMEEGCAFYDNMPISVAGVIDVGEEIEDGFLLSLYRMKGKKVEVDPAFKSFFSR